MSTPRYAKQRLMPIVRDLIQTVVIGKTPGHQPASLQVHGSIANIMASMEVLDLLEQQFIAAAQNDLMAKITSGEIDTEQKQKSSSTSIARNSSSGIRSGRIYERRWLRGPDGMETCKVSASSRPAYARGGHYPQ
jgi:hypothetical protein